MYIGADDTPKGILVHVCRNKPLCVLITANFLEASSSGISRYALNLVNLSPPAANEYPKATRLEIHAYWNYSV